MSETRSVFSKTRMGIGFAIVVLVTIAYSSFYSTEKSNDLTVSSSQDLSTRIVENLPTRVLPPTPSQEETSPSTEKPVLRQQSTFAKRRNVNSVESLVESEVAKPASTIEEAEEIVAHPTLAPSSVAVSKESPTAPVKMDETIGAESPAIAKEIPAVAADSSASEYLLPRIDFWIWGGLGVNYTSSVQSVEGYSNLEFGRIKSPSSMIRAGFYVSDHAGLDLGFKTTPGEASSSESITVTNGIYNWLTMSAEGLYRWTSDSARSDWTLRAGVQQHQMPFLIGEGVDSVSIVDTSLTNLSLGFEYRKQLKKKMRLEWLMRYQHPISASNTGVNSFRVTPKLHFDGSVGTAYQIGENTYVGIYWYGQYHDFDFKYLTDSSLEVSGRQSLFFTNFDLRLGMEF